MTTTLNTPQKSHKARRFVLKIVKAIFTIFISVYFIVLLYLYLDQRRLIFQAPSPSEKFVPMHLPNKAQSVILRTKDGDTVSAIFGPALTHDGQIASHPANRPTMLFFYGSGGSLDGYSDVFSEFRRLGVNVLIPDYVGYGRSSGIASEHNCYATADAAYDYLLSRPDIDPHKIVIVGYSLGTAVAIDLAKRAIEAHRPVAALASFSGFTNMPEMSHLQYPMFPEAILKLLVKYQFRSENKMRYITCPIMIGHSRTDHLVPYMMSDRLATGAGGPLTRITINQAEHGEFFSVGGPVVYPALERFILNATSGKERAGEKPNKGAKSFGGQN